jgi:hypothetical protein
MSYDFCALSNLISYSINVQKYEIILLTFGPSKIM